MFVRRNCRLIVGEFKLWQYGIEGGRADIFFNIVNNAVNKPTLATFIKISTVALFMLRQKYRY